MSELKDLKDLTLWTLWESPYGQKKVSLWKWLEMRNEWIEWNEVNRGEMSELKEVS